MTTHDQQDRPRRVFLRCAIIASMVLGGVVLVSSGCQVLLARDAAHGRLPLVLRAERVIVSHAESGGLQACAYVAYALDGPSKAKLRIQGLSLLKDGRPEVDGAHYASWSVTPIGPASLPLSYQSRLGEGRPKLFALRSNRGCGSARLDELPLNAEAMLTKAGNFYTVSDNGEGLLIVDPEHGTALYLYNG